jgi:hypothetical protein
VRVTSKFCPVAMFVISNVKNISVEFVGVFVICLHITFHMLSSNSSLVIAIKPDAKVVLCSCCVVSYS